MEKKEVQTNGEIHLDTRAEKQTNGIENTKLTEKEFVGLFTTRFVVGPYSQPNGHFEPFGINITLVSEWTM